MSTNTQLLAAAFTEILGQGMKVVLKEEKGGHEEEIEKSVTLDYIFNLTYDALQKEIPGHPKPSTVVAEYRAAKKAKGDDGTPKERFKIYVKRQDGLTYHYSVTTTVSVYDLKESLCKREGNFLLPNQMLLIFTGMALQDDQLLVECDIQNESTIHLIYRQCGGGRTTLMDLDEGGLDPQYDFDFTSIKDNRVFQRGSYTYKRPCGWNRIALKVKGKYEDDVWLGAAGSRRHSSPGEWAVSYHGTGKLGIKGIAESGYDSSKLERELHGKGHYSTPDIEVAALYAQPFILDRKRYKMVFQNRVNLDESIIIPEERTGAGAEYFVTPLRDNIRPYGICIKEY